MMSSGERVVMDVPSVEPAQDAVAASPPPAVSVRDLIKRFRKDDGSEVAAVDNVSLDVAEGEFVVLLGPSGCGKTTLLRSLAGLEHPDAGSIDIHGQPAFCSRRGLDLPPDRRRLSMIFQSYALWPHMTAARNVAYPLESRGAGRRARKEVAARVARALEMVGLPDLGDRYPNQLSGGQQQRVALARALVGQDELVLLDEPLSNVDAKVREQLRLELLSMQRELGFTAVYVTHDQAEAMELADRVAVMELGRIAQIGSPREIYDRPRSRYVAHFIGTSNELTGTVAASREPERVVVATPLGEVLATPGEDGIAAGDEAVVVWRPERTLVSGTEPDAANRWPATVRASLFLGPHTQHVVAVGEQLMRLWSADTELLEEGARVWISVAPAHVRALAPEQRP